MTELTSNLYQRLQSVNNKKLPTTTSTISYEDICEIINSINLLKVEIELLKNELKNKEAEKEYFKHRYTNLYDLIPFGYLVLKENGLVLEANEFIAELFGLSKKDLINKNFSRYITPDDHHLFLEYIKKVLNSTQAEQHSLRLTRKNGPIFSVNLRSQLIFNPVTNEKNIIMFICDDKANLETYYDSISENFMFKEPNQSVGELASVIVHEINNPLSIIINFLHGSIRRIEQNHFNAEEILPALKKAVEQSSRISDIVLRMKDFTYKTPITLESIDINELIKHAIELIQLETNDIHIPIYFQPVKNIPQVLVDRIYIEQVVLHLIRNAIDSLQDAKIIEPKVIVEINQISTKSLEISIINNGLNISKENIHKLFSPYFTTKKYGTGLGLAISKTIIQAHFGTIKHEPNPIGGSCFKFTLPLKTP